MYDECVDTNVRSDGSIIGDRDGDGCILYAENPYWCAGNHDTNEFIADVMCCACGGGRDPEEEPIDDSDIESGGDDGENSGDEEEINC